MKHIEIIATMVSPMLASSIKPEDGEQATDTFLRDSDNNILIKQNQLYSMLGSAKAIRSSSINIDSIKFGLAMASGDTEVYLRSYRTDGQLKYRKHESVPIGKEIRLRMYIPDKITLEDVAELFECAGGYVGLSPYGHRFGFGRFNVTGISEVADLHDLGSVEPDLGAWVPGQK